MAAKKPYNNALLQEGNMAEINKMKNVWVNIGKDGTIVNHRKLQGLEKNMEKLRLANEAHNDYHKAVGIDSSKAWNGMPGGKKKQKNLRKKSKKSSKKVKSSRKCPKDLAKDFKLKTVKKGLDGKMWIVSKRSDGVKTWKKKTLHGSGQSFSKFNMPNINNDNDNDIMNVHTNLNELKKCNENYKFCNNGDTATGFCIRNNLDCGYNTDDRYPSELTEILYELEKVKLTADNFDYSEIYDRIYNTDYEWRYKFTDIQSEEILSGTGYVLKLNMNNYSEHVGFSYKNIAHRRIMSIDSPELLGWLLAGFHDLTHVQNINTSFLTYYFNNDGSVLVPEYNNYDPLVKHVDLIIADGRHRLGLYNYFKTDGLIFTNNPINAEFLTTNNYATDQTSKYKLIITNEKNIYAPVEPDRIAVNYNRCAYCGSTNHTYKGNTKCICHGKKGLTNPKNERLPIGYINETKEFKIVKNKNAGKVWKKIV